MLRQTGHCESYVSQVAFVEALGRKEIQLQFSDCTTTHTHTPKHKGKGFKYQHDSRAAAFYCCTSVLNQGCANSPHKALFLFNFCLVFFLVSKSGSKVPFAGKRKERSTSFYLDEGKTPLERNGLYPHRHTHRHGSKGNVISNRPTSPVPHTASTFAANIRKWPPHRKRIDTVSTSLFLLLLLPWS